MTSVPGQAAPNRVLVVDDDTLILGEYLQCLDAGFESDQLTRTIGDLQKALFGDEADEPSALRFTVDTRRSGEAAVAACHAAIDAGMPYAIVFIDIHMPPGIDGIEAAKQIRALDPGVNIVIVTGIAGAKTVNLGRVLPPADKVFFFKKPFHAVECRQLAAALCGKWHSDAALRTANERLEVRVAERTEALKKLAYFDTVTRLPNKLLLMERLEQQIARAEDGDGDTAVILLDVYRFSFINETLGFEAGSELLRSIGNRLSRSCPDTGDGQRPVVGRFGADEFAILAPGVESETAIKELAETIRSAIEQPFLIDGRDLFLKVATGVAWHPVHGRDAKSVFRCAEAALHRSMRTPDNAVTYYHNEMRYRARYKFDLEAELRSAIEGGQVVPHYQPQQSTRTGKLSGLEALARWTRPDGSIVPPGDFVPLSEEMGISDLLFESMLDSVCRDLTAWRETSDWETPVSINLSAHQLHNKRLVNRIKGTLQAAGLESHLINIELTETVLLEDLNLARPVLDDLAECGVGIHIDDFGTGYSSLSYLAQLPVQTLKIDQAFISKLSEPNESNHRVVEAIIALGKAMQLTVVAEGVETDRQYAVVRRLGCDLAQGFFIAQPMPSDQLLTWVHGYEDTQNLKRKSAIVDLDTSRNA